MISNCGYKLLALFSILLCQLGCTTKQDHNKGIENWVNQNEIQLYEQLHLSLKNEIENIKSSTDLVYESFVYTKYDTTILGKLAEKINTLDSCLITEYKIFRKQNKIDLIISKPDDIECDKKRLFFTDTTDLKKFRLIFN